jgi:phosphomannomutase
LQEKIEHRSPLVLIARDGRVGGESTYTAAISGLLATGCRVRRLGVAMTPTAGMQCDLVGADAAVIITASHNPQEWNGLKVIVREKSWIDTATDCRGVVEGAESDACAPNAASAEEIVSRYRAGQITWWSGQNCQDSTVDDDVEDPHCLRVLGACERALGVNDFWAWFEERLQPRVVVDSVNSSGSVMCRVMFEGSPCHLVSLYGEMTGIFPHTPEPTRENLSGEGGLCDAVPGLKADVGFAQDPDADRLAIVDEKGGYIGEEYTLVLCAAALMEGRKALGEHRRDACATGEGRPVFVVNLSTSRMIDDVAAHYGAEVEGVIAAVKK